MTAARLVRHEVRMRWLNTVSNRPQLVQSADLAELWRDGTQLCQLMGRLQPELTLRYHKRVVSQKVAMANIELALNVLRQKSGPRFIPSAEDVYFGGEPAAFKVLEQTWLAFVARPLRSKQATAAVFRWAAGVTRSHGRVLTKAATRSPFELLAAELSDGVVFGLLAYAFCQQPSFGEGKGTVKLPLWSQPSESDRRLSNLHAVWAALQSNGVELWLTPEEWLLGADEHIALVMLNDLLERFNDTGVAKRTAPVRFRDTPTKAQLAAMEQPSPPTDRPALSAPKVIRGSLEPERKSDVDGSRPAFGRGSATSERFRSGRFESDEERERKLREAAARLAPPKRTGYRMAAPPPIGGATAAKQPEPQPEPEPEPAFAVEPEPEPEPESRQDDPKAELEALLAMDAELRGILYGSTIHEGGEAEEGALSDSNRASLEALLSETQEMIENQMAQGGIYITRSQQPQPQQPQQQAVGSSQRADGRKKDAQSTRKKNEKKGAGRSFEKAPPLSAAQSATGSPTAGANGGHAQPATPVRSPTAYDDEDEDEGGVAASGSSPYARQALGLGTWRTNAWTTGGFRPLSLRMLMLMAPRRAWLAAATNHRRWLDRLPPLTLTVTATAAATVAASSMQRSQPSIEILTSIVAVGVAVAERLHK